MKTTIDGREFDYNPATHLVETRRSLRAIRTARRQPGWVVSEIRQRGQGCYISSSADVLRPLYPREVRAKQASDAARAKLAAEKEAELAAMSPIAIRAIREAICLRKGKVRAPAYLYKELTGEEYTGRSPYGPRLGRFLAKCGIANPVAVIARHVTGLKPW